MLSTQFVNLSCLLCITETQSLKLSIFKDLKEILRFYRNDEEHIPLEFKLKFSLAETLCNLRLEGFSKDVILDNIKTTEKFASLGGYVASLETQSLNDRQIAEYIKHIRNHKKLVVSLDNYDEMRDFFEKFEQNNFPSIQEATTTFDTVISKVYSKLSNEKREEDVVSITKLDLLEDSYESAIDQIKKNYSGENAISTGYPEFDKFIRKGFEPGRLYIIAGKSGDGKSTLILNFLKNQLGKKIHDKNLFDIHLYVTLENHIDESLLRLYCCLNKLTTDDVLDKWDYHKNLIMPSIKEASIASKNIILMYYYHPTSISALDIVSLCEEIKQQYAGKGKLASITVDYLDVLKSSGNSYDVYRLELGQVTTDLKVLAVMQNVPVITVTHLNRSAYDDKVPMSLNQMGEAMKKVERADFVALIKIVFNCEEGKEENESNNNNNNSGLGVMKILIEKNRSGPKKKLIELKVDLSKFDISSNVQVGDTVPIMDKKSVEEIAKGSFL